MILFQDTDVNRLMVAICKELLVTGVERRARGLKTMELDDIVSITLESPANSVVTLYSRRKNLKSYYYLEREFRWYLSGDLDCKTISQGNWIWKEISNPNGTVNSNYGFIALKEQWNGRSQFDWCIEQLMQDKNTRQAVINYSQPRDKYAGNKDFVCTIGQQFVVRKNKLNSIVWMRSNDLITGFCNDVPWFTYLQQRIAAAINLEVGTYNHIVTSLHVYEKDFGTIEELSKIKISSDIDIRANYIWKAWNDYTDGKSNHFYRILTNSDVI